MTALFCAALPGPSRAQPFASKPVTILIAYPPGGPADLIAHSAAEVMAVRMNQAVVVHSKPGAGGQMAANAALQAPPDGRTLLLGDVATLGTNRFLFKNFSYDPLVDFDAVAPLLVMPMALFVPQASPYGSLAELIAASKIKSINFASQGVGSTGHLLGEMLRRATGGQFNHVPYKGSAPAMADLVVGHVDLLFDGVGPGLPHVAGRRLRALAVAGPKRLSQMPEVFTTAELGCESVSLSVWFGMVTRAGTPPSRLGYLHDEVAYAIEQPGTARRFDELGFAPLAMTAAQFTLFMKSESQRWAAFIKESGIATA